MMHAAPTQGQEFRRGWVPLLAAFAGTSFGISALFFYSLGIFIKPLQAEFGWSRAAISSVTLFAGFGSALMAPVMGHLADRFGVRRVGVVSLLGLAGGFWLVSRTNGVFGLFVAATVLLATVGAGSSAVVFSRLVNVWFDRAKGIALGISAAGAGCAGILVPRLLPGYVAAHGWRAGYAALALLPLLIAPVVALCAWERPQAVAQSVSTPPVTGLTLAQARRTGRFWQMCAAFLLVSLASGGFIVHFFPLLSDAGLSPRAAGGIVALVGLSVVGGRLGTGLLIDRVFAPYVAAGLFAISALGCALLAWGGARVAPVSAVMVGFSFGAEVDLVAFLAARYFGLRAIGAIYGLLYGCFTAGVAIGPLLTGTLHDRFGGYSTALLADAALLLIAAALVTRLGGYLVPEAAR